jgi:hypothetical protein
VRIQLPGVGRSIDSIVLEAFKVLGCEPWGGASKAGWSKQADFLRCPYRAWLKHVRGVGPLIVGDASPALDIGSVCHLMLAARYAAMLPDARYPGWRERCPSPEAVLAAMVVAGLPTVISSEVERLYDGYAEKWGAEDIAPVAVEMPVGLAARHTSRYDLVFYIEDGVHDGLWVGEHKTMSSATDIDEFTYDGEVLGEMLSWRLSDLDQYFGAPLNGVCINALVKASKLPRYQRKWIPVNWRLVEEYEKQRIWWIKQELYCKEKNFWPKNLFGCKSRYHRCRFWEHCRTMDDAQLIALPPRGV